jgi:hypothetical protein
VNLEQHGVLPCDRSLVRKNVRSQIENSHENLYVCYLYIVSSLLCLSDNTHCFYNVYSVLFLQRAQSFETLHLCTRCAVLQKFFIIFIGLKLLHEALHYIILSNHLLPPPPSFEVFSLAPYAQALSLSTCVSTWTIIKLKLSLCLTN